MNMILDAESTPSRSVVWVTELYIMYIYTNFLLSALRNRQCLNV